MKASADADAVLHLTGAEILRRSLVAAGITHLFHLPGVQSLGLLRTMEEHGGLTPVWIRHEQAGPFGAIGYFRSSGRVAACMAVPGPGATNMVTGISAAFADRVPFLLLTIPVDPAIRGLGCVHDIDVDAILAPVVKRRFEVAAAADIPATIAQAHAAATQGTYGPVQIVIPTGVLNGAAGDLPGLAPPRASFPPADAAVIGRVADMLNSAEHPLIYVGERAADHADAIRALAERLNAPVFTEECARGVIPEDHRLCIGTSSHRHASPVIAGCDACLAVGAGFSEWSTSSWTLPLPQPLAYLTDDPGSTHPRYPAAATIAPVAEGLAALLGSVRPRTARQPLVDSAALHRQEARREAAAAPAEAGAFHPARVLAELSAIIPGDAVVTFDGSATGMWASEEPLIIRRPRSYIGPEVGKELGSAILVAAGAKLADPSRPVLAVQGDGGFLFQTGDLSGLVSNGIAIVVLVFNDGYYNADRLYQEHIFGGGEASVRLANPDFPALARAFGLRGVRIGAIEELGPAIAEALRADRATVIDVPIDHRPMPYRFAVRLKSWMTPA